MGSGNFLGHALPAIFFVGFGSFFLLLTLKRCRDLQKAARVAREAAADAVDDADGFASPSFADAYLPERNELLILRCGRLLMICSLVGGAYETMGGITRDLGFFHAFAHQALYLSFLFVGAVGCLEGKKIIFMGAHRYALTFSFLLQFVLWHEHAIMKEEPADVRVHMLQAYVNFAAFVIFAYATYDPKSVFAYVGGWAVIVLNGMWMFTAGLNACCVEMLAHAVGAALVLEALFVASMIVLCMACFLDPSPSNQRSNVEMKQYSVVQTDIEEGLVLASAQ
ncbi:hypothetical protein ACHAXT_006576 [Thalassiosira profunda]